MLSFQHRYQMPIFTHNFTLLSPNTCFMVLALLTDVLRTMSAKSVFQRPTLHRLSSRRMAILIMLTLTMVELFKSIRMSLIIDMWFLIPDSSWYCLTIISTWKSMALSRQWNIFTSIHTYKGPDRAIIQTEGHDEICAYLDARYISSTQACHHIFEFPMHMEWPAVYHLSIHLPGQ